MDARRDRIECNGDVAKSPACARPNTVGLMHEESCGETKSSEHGGRGYAKTEYIRPIKTEKHVSSDEKHVSSDDASDDYFYVIEAEDASSSSRRTNEQCDVIKREERDSQEPCSAIDNNVPLYVTESVECSVNEELGCVSEPEECFTNDDSIGDFYVTESRTCASNTDVHEDAYSGSTDDEPSTVVQTEQCGRGDCVSQSDEQVHSCAFGGIRATNGSDVSIDAIVCSESDETKSRHCHDAGGGSHSSVNGLRRRSDRRNAARRSVNETKDAVTAKAARPTTYVVTNTPVHTLPRLAPHPARVRHQSEKSHKYHNPYACDVCGKRFPTQSTLAPHQKNTQCKSGICQNDSQQSEKLQEYVNRRYICDVCGRRFATQTTRARHRRETKCASGNAWLGVKQHLCSTCGKLFPTASTLTLHSEVHADEKRYTCPVCDKNYASQKGLRFHSQVHLVLEFTCDTCGEVFPRPGALAVHKRSRHQSKSFSCVSCDKAFTLKSYLKQHESIHTGVKAYVCAACGSSFRTSSILCKHKMQVHSDGNRVMCATCGKVLRGADSLRIHMRYHTGEKPYACAVCGTSFAASGALRDHEKIHTNTKPYTCSTCGKSFVTVSQVRTHEKSHSDVKPYSCNVCGQSFTLPHHRRAHEKTHARSGGKNETK